MVKNTIGGKKNKAFSRKDANKSNHSNSIRLPEDELECFAKVTKMFGNSMCQVTLLHNHLSIMAHIRSKMTGKNKRAFTIHINDFLIVGLRHWESSPKHCDVIHIFSEFDINSISSLPAFSHLFINYYNSINLNLNTISSHDEYFSFDNHPINHNIISNSISNDDLLIINNNHDELDNLDNIDFIDI